MGDVADLVAQVGYVNLPLVEAVEQDLSLARAVEAHQQAGQGALARAAAADDADPLASVQVQADFGQCLVSIGGEGVRVHVAVLTLGYSRRLLVRAFRSEKQDHWLQTLEEGFRHWGGVPHEVLVDNARALVSQHDPEQQILVFAQRLEEFASYWGFKPRACRPYRARTKGKDERGVAYVKRNAIAGREFRSWAEFEAHLVRWSREVADLRVHGTTGEALVGATDMLPPAQDDAFRQLLAWADGFRDIGIRANADTPTDAQTARDFGAQGIGLCRTEHMFFDEDRLVVMREMIFADTPKDRAAALARLLPMQRDDFVQLFEIMAGLPVCIRLFDPPLHEFLPHSREGLRELAETGVDRISIGTLTKDVKATDFSMRLQELS